MVASIAASTSVSSAYPGRGGNDVATASQLERCQRQLGDWVACPAGKTPEGQKIIDNLRAQIARLEQRSQVQSGTSSASPSSAPGLGAGSYGSGSSGEPMRLNLWV